VAAHQPGGSESAGDAMVFGENSADIRDAARAARPDDSGWLDGRQDHCLPGETRKFRKKLPPQRLLLLPASQLNGLELMS